MRNLEPLIAEINFILDSVDVPPANQLERIANWYSDEVDFLNDELLRTHQLFATGEKQKAFQTLLNGDPNLRENYRLIDFDRSNEWANFCTQQKITVPSEIEHDTFESLESALDDFAPVESLLERMRILVLGDAPAFSRHAILRLLCRRDPSNPAWKEDLLSLERFRIQRLPVEIAEARDQFDRKRLIDLATEIKTVKWESDIPSELKIFVQESKQQDFGTGILFELNELSAKMVALFEARKWEEANLLKKDWDALYHQTDDKLKESMSGELNDAIDWAKRVTGSTERHSQPGEIGSKPVCLKQAERSGILAGWAWVIVGMGAGFGVLGLLYWLAT